MTLMRMKLLSTAMLATLAAQPLTYLILPDIHVHASPNNRVGPELQVQLSPSEVYQISESRQQANRQLRFVRDSGVCETTPGVGQMSGYIDISQNMSMWFWSFEARENSDTAPFTLWLNGGPGCSSMAGLFQENGPCHVLEDGQTTVLNPFSWNNISNMIYIDQPIGTGFSSGTTIVNSTKAAAPFFWRALQILFESEEFSKFRSRKFIFATESYGGRYGPDYITYFNQQNELIAEGIIEGVPIVVSTLLINNGWIDPLLQFESYIDFVTDAPGYGPLQPSDVLTKINESYYQSGGCKDQELACYSATAEDEAGVHGPGNFTLSDNLCMQADGYCIDNVRKIAVGDRNEFDLRQNSSASFPPDHYRAFLRNDTIKKWIGAENAFKYCSKDVSGMFFQSGDIGRTSLRQLGALADSGMRILIWVGDTDINCNWLGIHAVVLSMDWFGHDELVNTRFANMTINGKRVAEVQSVGNFSFARVLGAGHKLPAFQPEAAFVMFSQIIKGEPLHSV